MTGDRTRIGAAAALESLPGWVAETGRDAIARRYVFEDFKAAFGFMTHVAEEAERLGHHPEWSHVYNRVDVVLTTHSAGGVTALDVALARFMDAAAGAGHGSWRGKGRLTIVRAQPSGSTCEFIRSFCVAALACACGPPPAPIGPSRSCRCWDPARSFSRPFCG